MEVRVVKARAELDCDFVAVVEAQRRRELAVLGMREENMLIV